MSVLNDTSDSVIATLAVGTAPEESAVDSGNGNVYEVNSAQGTVSIIAPTTISRYLVTFTESGLPGGDRMVGQRVRRDLGLFREHDPLL